MLQLYLCSGKGTCSVMETLIHSTHVSSTLTWTSCEMIKNTSLFQLYSVKVKARWRYLKCSKFFLLIVYTRPLSVLSGFLTEVNNHSFWFNNHTCTLLFCTLIKFQETERQKAALWWILWLMAKTLTNSLIIKLLILSEWRFWVPSRWRPTLRWFPSFALRIPTAQDFCVISVR